MSDSGSTDILALVRDGREMRISDACQRIKFDLSPAPEVGADRRFVRCRFNVTVNDAATPISNIAASINYKSGASYRTSSEAAFVVDELKKNSSISGFITDHNVPRHDRVHASLLVAAFVNIDGKETLCWEEKLFEF